MVAAGRTKFERLAPEATAAAMKILEYVTQLRRLSQRGADVSSAKARATAAGLEVIATSLKEAVDAEISG